jgi:hypothetical protein
MAEGSLPAIDLPMAEFGDAATGGLTSIVAPAPTKFSTSPAAALAHWLAVPTAADQREAVPVVAKPAIRFAEPPQPPLHAPQAIDTAMDELFVRAAASAMKPGLNLERIDALVDALTSSDGFDL